MGVAGEPPPRGAGRARSLSRACVWGEEEAWADMQNELSCQGVERAEWVGGEGSAGVGKEVQEMGHRLWGCQQDRVWILEYLRVFRECWTVPDPPGAVSEGEMRGLP